MIGCVALVCQVGLNHNTLTRFSWGKLPDHAPSPEPPVPLLRRSQAIQTKSTELISPKWAKHTWGWHRTLLLGQPLAMLQDNRWMLGFAALWTHHKLWTGKQLAANAVDIQRLICTCLIVKHLRYDDNTLAHCNCNILLSTFSPQRLRHF